MEAHKRTELKEKIGRLKDEIKANRYALQTLNPTQPGHQEKAAALFAKIAEAEAEITEVRRTLLRDELDSL